MNGRFRLTVFVLIVVATVNHKEVGTIAQRQLNRITPQAIAMKPKIDTSMLLTGQRLGRFEVTSVFGKRVSPGGIGSTDHRGVDVAMPIGTPIFMPLGGTVECRDEKEGNPAGTYARIRPDGLDREFLAAHLSKCFPGRHKKGGTISLSGNSGNSTGPHLHWGERLNRQYIPPQKGYLDLTLGVTK